MVSVGDIIGGDEAIAVYALHLESAWAQHGLMQVPGSCVGIDAALDKNLFLSFHCLHKYKFLERCGGRRHPWR